METMETTCIGCGKVIMATEDDLTPRCNECQGEWAEVQLVQAITEGEMDEIVEGLGAPPLEEGEGGEK